METRKNTQMRDENGNIREGVKWIIEINDILKRFFGDKYAYQGFQRVVIGKNCYLAGMFELDADQKPTDEFFEFIKDYQSEYLRGIAYQKNIESNGRNLYRNAVIALL